MTFRIEGMRDIERALEAVALKSTRVAITRRALQKAAAPMLAMARQYAPIDQGDLEQSIKIGTRATGEVGRAAYSRYMSSSWDAAKAAGTQAQWDRVAESAKAVTALKDARRAFKASNPPAILYMGPTREGWHGHFVEFGTAPHVNGGKFAGTSHPGTAPQPFMRPAFDTEARPTIERLKPLVWVEIRKNAARMAKRRSA